MLLSEVKSPKCEMLFDEHGMRTDDHDRASGKVVVSFRRPLGRDMKEFNELMSSEDVSASDQMRVCILMVAETVSGVTADEVAISEAVLDNLPLWMVTRLGMFAAELLGGTLDLGEAETPSGT